MRKDFESFKRYHEQLKDDPVRIGIVAAHKFIEEMMELVMGIRLTNPKWSAKRDYIQVGGWMSEGEKVRRRRGVEARRSSG